MKLLFDENLSPRLLDTLQADFPDSTHIERLKMRGATDAAIWAYARNHGYTIVSKDFETLIQTTSGSTRFSMDRRRRFSGWLSETLGLTR